MLLAHDALVAFIVKGFPPGLPSSDGVGGMTGGFGSCRPEGRPLRSLAVWTQLGQPLSRCSAPRMWMSGSEPMYLPRVSYTSKDGLVLFFFVAASEPVAVPRTIA